MQIKTKTRTRALGAVALTLVLGAGVTACGDDTSDASGQSEVSATEHNDADVAFFDLFVPFDTVLVHQSIFARAQLCILCLLPSHNNGTSRRALKPD